MDTFDMIVATVRSAAVGIVDVALFLEDMANSKDEKTLLEKTRGYLDNKVKVDADLAVLGVPFDEAMACVVRANYGKTAINILMRHISSIQEYVKER